jgi:hypothetical protein
MRCPRRHQGRSCAARTPISRPAAHHLPRLNKWPGCLCYGAEVAPGCSIVPAPRQVANHRSRERGWIIPCDGGQGRLMGGRGGTKTNKNSLFSRMTCLFSLRLFPVRTRRGNCGEVCAECADFGHCSHRNRAVFVNFPVFFPVSRDYRAETGSIRTAFPAKSTSGGRSPPNPRMTVNSRLTSGSA